MKRILLHFLFLTVAFLGLSLNVPPLLPPATPSLLPFAFGVQIVHVQILAQPNGSFKIGMDVVADEPLPSLGSSGSSDRDLTPLSIQPLQDVRISFYFALQDYSSYPLTHRYYATQVRFPRLVPGEHQHLELCLPKSTLPHEEFGYRQHWAVEISVAGQVLEDRMGNSSFKNRATALRFLESAKKARPCERLLVLDNGQPPKGPAKAVANGSF